MAAVTWMDTPLLCTRGRSGRSMKIHVTPSAKKSIHCKIMSQCSMPITAMVLVSACSSIPIQTKTNATSIV